MLAPPMRHFATGISVFELWNEHPCWRGPRIWLKDLDCTLS